MRSPRTHLAHREAAREQVRRLYVDSPSEDAIAARHDFAKFRWFVKHHKSYDHHRSWEPYLNTGLNSRCLSGIAGDDLLLLAPRGSSKSTFLIEWCAWQIGRHAAPEIGMALKILYISYELKTARQKSQQIKRMLQLPEYKQVFPWIRPGENWANELWEIDFAHAGLPAADEPYTVAAAGLIGNVTGKRCHLSVYDDLIKSPDAIANPDIREQMSNNYKNIIKPTRFEGGRSVCLGTRMREDDIYCTDFIPEKGWQVIEQSAILTRPDGTEYSYWEPEDEESPGQSLHFLQSIRDNPDEFETFCFQYQNVIIKGIRKNQTFDPNWIVDGMIPNQMLQLVLGVDLSAGQKQTNDYTAFCLGGMALTDAKFPHFYTIDCHEERIMGNNAKLKAIHDLYNCWKHLCSHLWIYVESNGYQLSFAGDYQDYVAKHGLYDWHIIPVPSTVDKLARLRSVTGILENRCHTFNKYCRLSGKLKYQLTQHGATKFDDLADAWEKMLSGLRSRQPLTFG